MPQQEKELRRYLFDMPRHALPGIIALCIFLLCTLIIAQEGDTTFTLAFAATGVLLSFPLLWLGLIMPLQMFNTMLTGLSDHMPEVLADFAAAREVEGLCRIGERYLFGYHRSMIIDLTATSGISLLTEVYTHHHSEKADEFRTRFVCRIGSDTLCEVDGSMNTLLKLRELVTMLHGKCPIEKDVYIYCVLWDKKLNTPKL